MSPTLGPLDFFRSAVGGRMGPCPTAQHPPYSACVENQKLGARDYRSQVLKLPSLGAVRVPGIRDSGLPSLKKVGALTVGDTGDLGAPVSRQDF